jgi:hypothetical protein
LFPASKLYAILFLLKQRIDLDHINIFKAIPEMIFPVLLSKNYSPENQLRTFFGVTIEERENGRIRFEAAEL